MVERQVLYLRMRASSLAKAEANCGPLSEMMESWRLKHLNTKLKKELGNSIGIDSLGARGKNYPLCKAMVDHDH